MKLTLIAVLLFISSIANAQSFKSDFFFLHHTNVPDRLIYDQIKTYSFNANSTGEFLPYDAISNNTLVLSAYQSAANADMKIQVDYGPLQIVEEKTRKSSKTEEVNKVKVTTYTYAREINFRFPISYKATNTKNNVLIWNGQMLNTTIHNITTPEFNTEAEAITYVINNKLTLMPTKAAEIVNNFTGNQNAYFKRGIDFYPTQTEMEIFRFKKWKRDDEYNDHVKNVIKIFNQSTYEESPKLIFNKVKTDIDFFNSFDGQFNPKDKDDDILYWGNYMNLATIYYSLDDVEKADFYLKKLSDSSEKKTDYVKSLKN